MSGKWLVAVLASVLVTVALSACAYSGDQPLGKLGFLVVSAPDCGVDVEVTLRNRSTRPTPQLAVTLDVPGSAATTLPVVPPGGQRTIRHRDEIEVGAAGLTANDPSGRRYMLVGYFEQSLGGRIDIRVDDVDADGRLSGSVRTRVSYFGSDDWVPLVVVED